MDQEVTVKAAKEQRDRGFNYAMTLAQYLSIGLALALALAFAVYGVIRAIGWVIGGFVVS